MRAVGFAALLCGCAVQPALVHDPLAPAAVAWRDRRDWPAAGDATVELLQAFLRVDTTNPPGNESPADAPLFAALARAAARGP